MRARRLGVGAIIFQIPPLLIEIQRGLARDIAIGDDRVTEDLRPASRDAIAFPARLLALANRTASADEISTFSELARMVGSTKEPYNDQR